MHTIDLEVWPRRRQFDAFRNAHLPHFNVCAEVDVGPARREARRHEVPITAVIVYSVARAANDIPEFRCRIRGDAVVEHDVVHPSSTVLLEDGTFSFCTYDYSDDFSAFVKGYETQTARARSHPTLSDPSDRDDLLFLTAIPWIAFTGFAHPILTIPVDSIPRFAWGRIHRAGDALRMPLSVQGHHSLIDGVHVGQYYERVEQYLRNPDEFMVGR